MTTIYNEKVKEEKAKEGGKKSTKSQLKYGKSINNNAKLIEDIMGDDEDEYGEEGEYGAEKAVKGKQKV